MPVTATPWRMVPAALLEVALPGRGSITTTSSVLSQVARFGQNRMPPLFSELSR
jgi:hypothetical protein